MHIKKFTYALLGCALLLGSIGKVWANPYLSSKLMTFPTKIIIEGRNRSAELTVINSGVAKGAFRIDPVTMRMPEEGALIEVPESENEKYHAASPLIKIAPKRIVLPPGNNQKVRLLLRKPEGLEDGEYRSHLLLKSVDMPGEEDEAPSEPQGESITINIKPRFGVMIPVIIRHGETWYKTKIQDVSVQDRPNGKQEILVTFSHEGNRAAEGDIKAWYTDTTGKRYPVLHSRGITIYRDTPVRRYSLRTNELEEGVRIGKGKLEVQYIERLEDPGQPVKLGAVLSEAVIEL